MNCWHCKTELIWGSDIDIDYTMPNYPEYCLMTNLSCPKCNSLVKVYLPRNQMQAINDI